MNALEVTALTSGYGTSTVLRNVSLTVPAGEVVAVMGRNGAGKTTLLRSLIGLLPHEGSVVLNGTEVSELKGHQISQRGMVWVPQDDSVFPGLTVKEHLSIAARDEDSGATSAIEMFPILQERLTQQAQTLSGGEKKMLSIAQALISRPSLILMDEPTEGIAPVVVSELMLAIEAAANKAAVLLVEQNIDVAVALSTHGYVLEHGSFVEEGAMQELHESGRLEERLAI